MKAVRRAWAGVLGVVRDVGPFLLCLIGGGMMVAGAHSNGFVGILLAGIVFVWALDVHAERAKAQAKSEVLWLFITALTSGKDTNIDVTVRNVSAPKSE